MTKGAHHDIAHCFLSRDRIEDEIDEPIAPEAYFFVESIQTIEQRAALRLVSLSHAGDERGGDDGVFVAGVVAVEIAVGFFVAEDEMARLSGIIARLGPSDNPKAEFSDCVASIRSENNKKSKKSAGKLSDEEFRKLFSENQ